MAKRAPNGQREQPTEPRDREAIGDGLDDTAIVGRCDFSSIVAEGAALLDKRTVACDLLVDYIVSFGARRGGLR